MPPSNDTSITLDFHRLATVEIVRPTEVLARQCRLIFGHFLADVPRERRADVIVQPLDEEMRRWAVSCTRKNPESLIVAERSGEPVVVHGYGRRVEVVAFPGDPITLCYDPGGRGSRKVVGRLFVYLQLALRRRGALLFKGAVLAKDHHGVVITGFSGGGKTSLLLRMLASGWDFLSDDTCILSDGVAHSFRPFVVLHHYHLDQYLRSRSIQDLGGRMPNRRPLHRWLRTFAMGRLPRAFERSQKLRRLCDPSFRIDPRTICPTCSMLDTVHLPGAATLWVTRPGERTCVRPISGDDALRRADAVQHMTYGEFELVCQNLAVFTGDFPTPSCETLIRANLAGLRAFEVVRRAGDDDESLFASLMDTLRLPSTCVGAPSVEPRRGAHA